jgi:hypothetical protein
MYARRKARIRSVAEWKHPLLRFDQEQARDELGRWTSGGGAPADTREPKSADRVGLSGEKKPVKGLVGTLAERGGFSYEVAAGRFIEGDAKIVSPYPERSKVFTKDSLTPNDLASYIAKNADLILSKDHFFGGWLDQETGKVYLDVSVAVTTDEEAHRIASEADQIAYWDNGKGETVYVNRDAKSGQRAVSTWQMPGAGVQDGQGSGRDEDPFRRGAGADVSVLDGPGADRGGDGRGEEDTRRSALQLRGLDRWTYPPGYRDPLCAEIAKQAPDMIRAFDPDQPRAEDGKWTSGGGGGASSQEPEETREAGSGSGGGASAGGVHEGVLDPIMTMETEPPRVGKPYAPSVTADTNGDGVSDAARVGVPAHSVPPPPQIPRLANLTPAERNVEENFASAYEKDPDAMVKAYNELRAAGATGSAPNVFATDDAKLLDAGWNPPGEMTDETRAYRAQFNVALHQTANAIVKKAFLEELDKVPKGSSVLVTAGGCGAGKGFALGNVDSVKSIQGMAAVVWDSAGDQNGTENPWIQEELDKRGLKGIYAYVHADPAAQWADPKRGVVQRALTNGRMIDTQVYVDSYIEGAKNFKAFSEKYAGKADFIFLQNGNPPIRSDSMPKAALGIDREELRRKCQDVLIQRYREGKINKSVLYGGLLGDRIWED